MMMNLYLVKAFLKQTPDVIHLVMKLRESFVRIVLLQEEIIKYCCH